MLAPRSEVISVEGLAHGNFGIGNWVQYGNQDGVMYVDPVAGDYGAEVLDWASRLSIRQLEASSDVRELGSGTRAVVFGLGELVIKKFHSERQPWVSGLPAVEANAVLARALKEKPSAVGPYALLGCATRGYFEPYSLARHPTWLMDFAAGENALTMLNPPMEATELMAYARTDACRTALQSCGIDDDGIYLDDDGPSNIIVGPRPVRTLTVIDVMASPPSRMT